VDGNADGNAIQCQGVTGHVSEHRKRCEPHSRGVLMIYRRVLWVLGALAVAIVD
jgi:hypothetical protein